MTHIELSDRDSLLKLIKSNKDAQPDNPQPRLCKICGKTSYPIFVKGRFIYTKCDCSGARPYKFSPPKK